jgi:hypothetical protein
MLTRSRSFDVRTHATIGPIAVSRNSRTNSGTQTLLKTGIPTEIARCMNSAVIFGHRVRIEIAAARASSTKLFRMKIDSRERTSSTVRSERS